MKSKKILFILAFIIFILLLFTVKSNASLYLNNLEYDVQIKENGDMDVTETWDIDISDTNTLYKIFELDDEKYRYYNKCKSFRSWKERFYEDK